MRYNRHLITDARKLGKYMAGHDQGFSLLCQPQDDFPHFHASFGIQPKVALLSRSNFGTHDSPSSRKMREALAIVRREAPGLEVDGEMHADAALSERIRRDALPDARLTGTANLLVMPNVEAANIGYNLLKALGGGVSVGPILMGAARSVHVLTQSITVRGLVNMSALACSRVDGVAQTP